VEWLVHLEVQDPLAIRVILEHPVVREAVDSPELLALPAPREIPAHLDQTDHWVSPDRTEIREEPAIPVLLEIQAHRSYWPCRPLGKSRK